MIGLYYDLRVIYEVCARFVQLFARILLTSGIGVAIHLHLDQQLTGES